MKSNKNNLVIALVVIVLLLGGYFVFGRGQDNQSPDISNTNLEITQNDEVMVDSKTNEEEKHRDSMLGIPTAQAGEYQDYSSTSFEQAKNKKRILFFHANWCPSCKVADSSIKKGIDQLPDDVVIFKTNYDKEKNLKSKYEVTYQHTFVQVDADGNVLNKWNGGDINKIISSIK